MPFAELYRRQVVLLIRVLPLVAQEKCFALKGGTAIEKPPSWSGSTNSTALESTTMYVVTLGNS